MDVCLFTGKLSHPTAERAKRHLASLRKRQGYRGEVFRCLLCKGYHVGASPKTKGRPKEG